jgi:Mrp family chromosome partitioning ATPase
MTALDKAFIKAYKHQGPAGRSAPTDAALSAPAPDVDSGRIDAQIASTMAKLNDVMAALEKPSSKIADTAAESAPISEENRSAKNEAEVLAFAPPPSTQASKSKSTQKRKKKTAPAPTIDELDVPEAIYRIDPPSPTIPDAPRAAAFTSPPLQERFSPDSSSNLPPCDTNNSPAIARSTHGGAADSCTAAGTEKIRRFDLPAGDAPQTSTTMDLPANGFYAEKAIRVFQPMLQVDHFAWPKVCHRLELIAALELDRLAETLIAAAKQGMKVVGLSGGQRGEGATTMLLCAARRLVTRNVKTVIVDADLGDPQLTKRLGLLPQLGWEDVAAGRQPVDEVLVESAADNLAILPLCGPVSISEISYASQRIMAESLNTLRKNYDLVLMDLGPLESPQSLGDLTTGGLNCRIDAVTVVHKVGKVLATCLPAVRQSLASAGVVIAGVIENFVRQLPSAETES